MHLYLSNDCAWNTNFCNAEGQVLYKAEDPSRFSLGNAVIISRVLPSRVDLNTNDEENLRDSFAPFAEVVYHTLTPSRIRYNGNDMAITKAGFFGRWGLIKDLVSYSSGIRLGSRHRDFTGPDGKEYSWDVETEVTACKVSSNRNYTLIPTISSNDF